MVTSLMLVLIIMGAFPVSAFAYEYGEFDIESMVVTKEIGEKTEKYISENDINRIRISKSISMKNKSDQERLYDIFTEMDNDMTVKEKEVICSSLDLNSVGSIRISEAFVEIDEIGNEKIVDKEYALKNSEIINKSQQNEIFPSTEWHSSNPETYKSGLITYMQQQLISVYTPNYNGQWNTRGRYVFFGTSNWLTTPLNRRKDCVTLSSDNFTWSNKDNGDYMGILIYDALYYRNGQLLETEQIIENIVDNDLTVLTTTGAYYQFRLPKNSAAYPENTYAFSNFTFFIMGVAESEYAPHLMNKVGVNLIYSHTQTTLSPSLSFGWSSDSGVNFGAATTFSTITKEYIHSLSWSMAEDYNKYL